MPAEGLEPPTNSLQIGLDEQAQKFRFVKKHLGALFLLIFPLRLILATMPSAPIAPRKSVPEAPPAESNDVRSTPRGAATSSESDLCSLLGELSDAISVVTVVQRSLAALEIAAVDDEETALRYALTLLRTTYSTLDGIIFRSS